MGLLGDRNDPAREARARMELEAKSAEKAQTAVPVDENGRRLPQRYKLYDKIKDKVSVTALNVIIAAAALLLVIALVYGIATGSPGQ